MFCSWTRGPESVGVLLNTQYPWHDTYCALSPDAKSFAYRWPDSSNDVMLRSLH